MGFSPTSFTSGIGSLRVLIAQTNMYCLSVILALATSPACLLYLKVLILRKINISFILACINHLMDTFLIVNYEDDFGRHGNLSGKYLCTQDTWDKLENRQWYATDVLGKHSEISGNYRDNFNTKTISKEQAEFLSEILDLDFKSLTLEWDDENEMYPPVITISGFEIFYYIREPE